MPNTNKSKPAVKSDEIPVVEAISIDPNQYVIVKNGFHGKLVYVSRHSGEIFEWDEFGAEQEMQLRELRNAKNSSKDFFINNWFLFEEDWIVGYLGVGKYYQLSIDIDNFDKLFKKTPDQIKKEIKKMSQGQKDSTLFRARELVSSGQIDSLKTIRALEESFSVELTEKD